MDMVTVSCVYMGQGWGSSETILCVCEGTRSLHDCVLASALLHVNVPLLVNVPASVCMYSAVCVK